MKKKNLLKLANYLELNVTQKMFNMQSYRENSEGDSVTFRSKTDCGTVGCALGYAPLVNGLEAIAEEFIIGMNHSNYLDFSDYCKRVLGICNYKDKSWEFLFASQWVGFDNTPEGAAARIKYLVDGNSLRGFNADFLDYDEEYRNVEAIEELILDYRLSAVLREV